MTCSNCVSLTLYAKGLCRACYEYRRRTGRDRDEHAAVARAIRRFERLAYLQMVRETVAAYGETG